MPRRSPRGAALRMDHPPISWWTVSASFNRYFLAVYRLHTELLFADATSIPVLHPAQYTVLCSEMLPSSRYCILLSVLGALQAH